MLYEKEFLLSLYRQMVRIRCCEESFVGPILNGEITCPVHLCSGQEAIAVGVGANLNREDKMFGNHRSHGHFLAKGGLMTELVDEVYCRESGCSRGRGGSMHLIDMANGFLGAAPIVAGTISMALGAALASHIQGNDAVAVSYFGDGAAGEGVLYESMNFAKIHNLPLLFVCENNFYATHMPIRETRSRDSIFETALSFDIKATREDGNNVLRVYELTNEAIAHCRSGNGPFFLEFTTYRLRGHVGADDNIQGSHTDIRPAQEIAEWRGRDPIPRFSQYLIASGAVSLENLEAIDRQAEAEVAAAHAGARVACEPRTEELAGYVFRKEIA
jgi:pyruvate dehydrogenase E1 component alpha subunit